MDQFSAIGPLIPGYRWQGLLGTGGSADVHLYRQEMPEREVAIKVLRLQSGAAGEAMMRREANVLAQVSAHPGIVSLYATGRTTDGASWMALEPCQPPRWHRGGAALSVAEVLRTGVLLAGALASVHALGLVHRDVKPANVLITGFGAPVLTDFGISGAIGLPLRQGEGGLSVPWSAPEVHLPNVTVDAAQDVYSLAATMWTWLVGASPFELLGGDNSREAMVARVLSAPVPRTGRRDVPESLEATLAAGMHRTPAERPAAATFGRLLQQHQRELGLPETALEVLAPTTGQHAANSSALAEDDPDATRMRTVTVVDGATAQRSFEFSEQTQARRAATDPGANDSNEVTAAQTLAPRRGTIGLVIALLAVLVIAGAIALTAMRGGGWTIAPVAETTGGIAEPVSTAIPSVTDLTVEIVDGQLVASWQAPDPLPDTATSPFGYSIQRAGEREIFDVTSTTSVQAPAVAGSNCIEVWVRGAQGQTSAIQRACVTA
ncbi:serine/threonine protein kinase [Gulosibacter macacae]|uniref:non-specific serine/threonine protein kinase n=1 Tax=Gulosibacter macacae TaxID=2488791 RepID=A0A3P3VUZ4_9MICO|nr:serine/threonine-protein kinase [Gulosibacter macacae]RRJ86147.1 serine/threonine protein kinase [Gulosibacter macacae]